MRGAHFGHVRLHAAERRVLLTQAVEGVDAGSESGVVVEGDQLCHHPCEGEGGDKADQKVGPINPEA